jgi:HlyD family secretion protein
MKALLVSLLVVLLIVGISAAAYEPALNYWKLRTAPQWRVAAVARGKITAVVNATGTIKPVRSLTIGSFVSGPIDPEGPIAEFNQEVKAGDILCRIDPRIHDANLKRDLAHLESSQAELLRAQAQLEQAERDMARIQKLQEKGKSLVADVEVDRVHFNVLTLKAAVGVAEAGVKVAQSQVNYSETQLKYCNIVAPEAGIVINRKIDPGQMLAAQFQTPELFVIAPTLRERVDVHASVDEADIGLIRRAQEQRLPVTFTVDAYPEELFHGSIHEVRMNSTTTQNVVTYPVIVASENQELKLLPGMTASLSFEVDQRPDTVKIPNAALRFFPSPRQVRDADRALVEGRLDVVDEDQATQSNRTTSAEERNEIRRNHKRRHVWVADAPGLLRAVDVVIGLSDSQYTEMLDGGLQPDDQVVVGQIPAITGWTR